MLYKYTTSQKIGVIYFMETENTKCVVHFLPAKAGDCILLELDNKNCILIDCGYATTYNNELKPLLQKLAKKGCKISLMIITHIDEDHIFGAISFIEDNGNAENPSVIQIDEIWHNGIFNTVMNSEIFRKHEKKEVPEDILNKCRSARSLLKKQFNGESGTISVAQSQMFERVCAKYHYRINSQFANQCVVKGQKYCFDDCEINILSPGNKEIEQFYNALNIELVKEFGKDYIWNKTEEFAELFELIALYKGYDEPGEFTIAQISAQTADIHKWIGTSKLPKMNAINCASIVTDIRYKGLKLLFMGDSESELWKEQLESYYDLIKVSHHGTTKPNLAWMNCTNAKKLLISTNGGKHRHPEDDFLARAIMGDFDELYFNYSILRKSEILLFQEKYNFKAEFEKREIILN